MQLCTARLKKPRLIQRESETRVPTDLSQPLHHFNPQIILRFKKKWKIERAENAVSSELFSSKCVSQYIRKSHENVIKEASPSGYQLKELACLFCKLFVLYKKNTHQNMILFPRCCLVMWRFSHFKRREGDVVEDKKAVPLTSIKRTASIAYRQSSVLDLLFTRCCFPPYSWYRWSYPLSHPHHRFIIHGQHRWIFHCF